VEPIHGPLAAGGDTASGSAGAAAFDPSSGLVAYFKLDEPAGNALDDAGAHTAAPVAGPLGSGDVPPVGFPDSGSRSFDGQGQYLSIPNNDELDFSGEITLAAWVKVAALTDTCQYIVGHGYCLDPPGEVVLRVGSSSCGPSTLPHYWAVGSWLSAEHSAVAPVYDIDVGAWVHVAGTYSEGAWHLYRNGQEIAEQPSDVGAVPVQNDWSIGARAPGLGTCIPSGPERYFRGAIDDVRIYRRALSAAEVEELYHL
jgi:hypothetical protein